MLPSTTSRRGPEIRDRTANPGQLILLVEDDRAIRELVRRRLLILGYQVLEAPDGDTALALADQRQGPLDLLLTDVVMPTMNGFALAARVTALHPETSVLFITGYADRPTVEDTLRQTPHAFLLKPFTATALHQKVQYLLPTPAHDAPLQRRGPISARFVKAIPVLYRSSEQTAWLRGLTVDISDSGIMLEAVSEVAPGTQLDLTFEATTAIGRLGSGTVRRRGRVVRHGTPTRSIPHPVGIQFISDLHATESGQA